MLRGLASPGYAKYAQRKTPAHTQRSRLMFRTCFTSGFSSREATGRGSGLGTLSALSCLRSIPQSHRKVLSSFELPLASAAPGTRVRREG